MFDHKYNISDYYDPLTNIIAIPEFENVVIPPGGLGSLLFERMKKSAETDAIALINAANGEEVLYSVFLQKCIRAAIEMLNQGLKRGDVISICSPNTPDCVVPFIAAMFIGVIPAPLDPTLNEQEIKYLLELIEPKLIFTASGSIELIESALQGQAFKVPVITFGEETHYEHTQFSKFILPKDEENEFKPTVIEDLEGTALILFSSGTTGLPKGICLKHEAMLQNASVFSTNTKVGFGYASLYWASTSVGIISALLNDCSRLLAPHPFDAKLTWDYLGKYKIDFLFLAPSDAIKFYNFRPKDIEHQPKVFCVGGSHVSNEYIVRYRELFPKCFFLYSWGQTEVMVCLNPFHPSVFPKIGCVGIPIPGRSYKFVDPETEQTVGPNQRGEIRVKTRWCMGGYYKRDSSSAWDEDGYIKTGDIGYFDDEFGFYIVDRIKEMFKYKSWHIVPAKLEAILLTHPDVELCCVVGIPHPEDDHHICAVVELKKGASATEEEIQRFVDEQTDDRHKLRAGVKFVNKMVYTASGKIRRNAVRDMILNGQL